MPSKPWYLSSDPINAIAGRTGCGKGVLATYLAYKTLAHLTPVEKPRFRLWSNMTFKGPFAPYYQHIEPFQLDRLHNDGESIHLVIWDEGAKLGNSRRSGSDLNQLLTDVIADTRKLGAVLYYIAHRERKIDVDIREATSRWYFPRITYCGSPDAMRRKLPIEMEVTVANPDGESRQFQIGNGDRVAESRNFFKSLCGWYDTLQVIERPLASVMKSVAEKRNLDYKVKATPQASMGESIPVSRVDREILERSIPQVRETVLSGD